MQLGTGGISTDCSLHSNLGTKTEISEQRVGDMTCGPDDSIRDTFRGSRISAGGVVVNQTATMTFDPATLMCTVCKVSHHIVPKNGANLVILATDQNFVPTLSGKDSCVPVIRMEDPTLSELFYICHEIFDKTPLPSGTLFLVSALSYLAKVGITMYSMEWQKISRYFSERWGQSSVGPLPPIPREDCAGTVGVLITQLHTWYNHCYGTNICYPKAAWTQLVDTIASNTTEYTDLNYREVLTVALPETLTSTVLTPFKFHRNTCHAVTPGLDGVATDVLLHVLLDQLSTSYGCQAHPEDILARAPAEPEDVQTPGKGRILVVGGSHAKRLVGELRNRGLDVTDLSVPGWTPTEENVAKLTADIAELGDIGNMVAVCDLISNVIYRFEQFDGTLCLAVNLDGRWHMAGKVTVCSKESIKHTLTSLKPVFSSIPGLKICLPPIPRYLQTPCCSNKSHCKDIEKPHYATDLMSKTQTVRKTMRDHLHATVSRVWVPDIYGMMMPDCNTTEDLANGFVHLASTDGVHLNQDGYGLLADCVKTTLCEQLTSGTSVSGGRPGGKPRDYYWRGFTSPVGSERPSHHGSFHGNRGAGGGKWKGVRASGPYANQAGWGKPPSHRPSRGRRWN